MSAVPAAESVVTVEHDGNLAIVTWHQVEPPRPPVRHEPLADGRSGEESASVRQAMRHLRRCWRRSQLRRDLIEWGWLIGLLAGGVIACIYSDDIHQLVQVLFGGAR